MSLGSGNKLRRKNKHGTTVAWERESARRRVALLPASYRDVEATAAKVFESDAGA